ncbi:prolyl oligopeptidase family serine peptidase [Bifidobacterium gallicum]|uniref:Cytochrome C n=1 Tax=Bifidobacterium gallicum DSM 20093 = LMG 11596 TaxID=561180 RepID=D1NW59_9BIFI|nr:prolyl oligopeptidase family serine peptidase [Bifidobacterium gallicum]EFA22345.1 peptidase, S9A/B/C family, catalytic domain protein [Bifidobacterium gallicum DSM 20093 = LMG 11596]KFI60058.1 cytochrome C [Bifidobacterium gallicum DSM 20093 = LMG 11596]
MTAQSNSVDVDDLAAQRAAIDNFAALNARTMSFRCGAPRTARLIGDGSRMLFLRSDGPENTSTSLWLSAIDVAGAHEPVELLIADPATLVDSDEQVPAEELARRQRARERATGIVAYSVDTAGKHVVFTIDGQLFAAELPSVGEAFALADEVAQSQDNSDGHCVSAALNVRRVEPAFADGQDGPVSPVLSPQISPDGTRVAYSTGASIVVVLLDEPQASVNAAAMLSVPAGRRETVTVGLAEFAAAEEMHRFAGLWWAPDSRTLLVERADSSREPLWYMANPADPSAEPAVRRYPRALTHNAKVSLLLVRLDEDSPRMLGARRVHWDEQAYEYLARVSWSAGHRPLLLVQNRLQHDDVVLDVQVPPVQTWTHNDSSASADADFDFATIATTAVERHHNDEWLDIIDGVPTRTPDGRLVCALNDMDADTNRLTVNGEPFTPQGWQVRTVLDVSNDNVLAVVQRSPELAADVPAAWSAQAADHDARSYDVVTIGFDGTITPVSLEPGVWSAQRLGNGLVLSGSTMASPAVQMVHTVQSQESTQSNRIADHAAQPGFVPNVRFVQLGERKLHTAIVLPSAASPYADAVQLPVLMKPYAGPGFQEVTLSQRYYWDSQWWADQGYMVVTADGRGTTGRGPRWDRAIYEQMKQVTLDDQIAAVQALPDAVDALADADGAAAAAAADGESGEGGERLPEPDLRHVSMIGWSYGGFISAAAVLEAPEVFISACAGAPPTDWTLYDTHYTERYLGLDPAVYERNSIIADAPNLQGRLMLIHGFADDNVTIANSLRLSQALMEAGKAHTFLPLVGVTHMTNEPDVAQNLLTLQRDFLQRRGNA